MNKGIKYIVLGLAAASLTAMSSFAQITVNYKAFNSVGLALAGGQVLVPTGDLIEIGSFASAPTQGTYSLTGFTLFGSSQVGTIGGVVSSAAGDGFWESSSTVASPADASFPGLQIYLIAYNASTSNSATQAGIFTVNPASNAAWAFPADAGPSTLIDINDLVTSAGTAGNALASGAHVYFGAGPVNGTGANAGYSLLQLEVIPEPSSIALVAAGLLGLIGISRRRRS